MIKRREFLMSSAAALASARAWGEAAGQAKLDRIAVMSSTFLPLLKGMARAGNPKATLDLMDLPGMVAERFAIHRVEFQHMDFPSTESAYLEEFRARLKKANAQISQIALDFANLNVSSPDPVILLETIELTKRWIDYAVALGCPRIMAQAGDLAPKVRDSAIATLKTINRYARAKKVSVNLQNRPGNPGWETIVEVVKAAGISADPDCGNFPDQPSRAAGLAAMYRVAGSSHIQHLPGKFDTAEAIRISKEQGFKGIYTIEVPAGNGPDPCAPVEPVLNVLLANI
jgi:sugar phosphate isomerase/epimerase